MSEELPNKCVVCDIIYNSLNHDDPEVTRHSAYVVSFAPPDEGPIQRMFTYRQHRKSDTVVAPTSAFSAAYRWAKAQGGEFYLIADGGWDHPVISYVPAEGIELDIKPREQHTMPPLRFKPDVQAEVDEIQEELDAPVHKLEAMPRVGDHVEIRYRGYIEQVVSNFYVVRHPESGRLYQHLRSQIYEVIAPPVKFNDTIGSGNVTRVPLLTIIASPDGLDILRKTAPNKWIGFGHSRVYRDREVADLGYHVVILPDAEGSVQGGLQ